ncbi:hypothetical protein MSAN_02076100 [Mycena sanguinolenta]|uniref:Uncharacterized protein n=1 Tax=Mycena sanguinolenta TaxID=230812 RepID=A0A8H6XI44_9AGAR|nr:hypothetical protein MSAN_02076100 [Mycena sanguinolenta]
MGSRLSFTRPVPSLPQLNIPSTLSWDGGRNTTRMLIVFRKGWLERGTTRTLVVIHSAAGMGGTYTGVPGSYYGPMYPAGTDMTPKRIVVVAGDPDVSAEKGRRMTLPSAFRSLRRSLTARRRRAQSSGSDDEEPVMVERTVSPLLTDPSATLTAATSASDSAATESTRVTSKTQSRSSPSDIAPPAPSKDRDVSSPMEDTKSAASPAKIQSLISSDRAVSKTPTGSSKSSKLRTEVQSATHSRSASTSAAARNVLTKGHARRSVSEHVHSPRPQRPHLPIAARFMTLPATPTTADEAVAPSSRAPSGPGASASAQNLPSKRRHASEQSPSSSEQPIPSATTSTRSSNNPRTSAPSTRSLSEAVPRTSRTMAMVMSPDPSNSPRTSAPSTRSLSEAVPRTSRTMAMAMSPDPE